MKLFSFQKKWRMILWCKVQWHSWMYEVQIFFFISNFVLFNFCLICIWFFMLGMDAQWYDSNFVYFVLYSDDRLGYTWWLYILIYSCYFIMFHVFLITMPRCMCGSTWYEVQWTWSLVWMKFNCVMSGFDDYWMICIKNEWNHIFPIQFCSSMMRGLMNFTWWTWENETYFLALILSFSHQFFRL